MRNSSGTGDSADIPDGVRGWSWGAFFLNWIWGIGNNTWIALLAFVPLVNIVMVFVLGFKGREWAWRNREWKDVEHFNKVQRRWSIAALVAMVSILALLAVVGFSISMFMTKSGPYVKSLASIQQNEQAIELLGDNISGGRFVTGKLNTSITGGTANIRYNVQGDKSKATAHVIAHHPASGEWVLDSVYLTIPETKERINVVSADN